MIELTQPTDSYRNYCLWPYQPLAETVGKFRPITLLNHSFELAGLYPECGALLESLRHGIGSFQTVYGIKIIDGQLAWEFYFYDYERRQRTRSIKQVQQALRPFGPSFPIDERIPYFMFSLDIDARLLRSQRAIDLVHVYVGNPGSTVSSGIAYAVTLQGMELENFYFFFDAKRDINDAMEKVYCSPRLTPEMIPAELIFWPELTNCHTICIANKRQTDTIYFSGVNVDQLLIFMQRLQYPRELMTFIQQHRLQLDHLLFDVGFDYTTNGHDVIVHKSGYYGVF